MNARMRAVAYLTVALYFGAALLLTRAMDAPPLVQAAGGFGMGAALGLSVAWWVTAEQGK